MTEPSAPPPPRRSASGGSVEARLHRQLADLFSGAALAVAAAGDDYSAGIIASRADDLAGAWARLAAKNARVRAIIESMVAGSAWGEAIVVTASVAVPIAWRHGLIPDGLPLANFMRPPVPASEEVRDHRPDGPAPGGPVSSIPITPTDPPPAAGPIPDPPRFSDAADSEPSS